MSSRGRLSLLMALVMAGCGDSAGDPTDANATDTGVMQSDADASEPDLGATDLGLTDVDSADLGDIGERDAFTGDSGALDAAADAEPTDAEPTDAEPADAEPADAEPADAEPADAEDAADAGEEDAEPQDAAEPDAEPDASEPDAEPSDAGFHRVTAIGPWESITTDNAQAFGDCGITSAAACTLWVPDGTFVELSASLPGQCYYSSSSLLCGASPDFTCVSVPPPFQLEVCNGLIVSDVSVAYLLYYDGAFSPCAPPPSSCPVSLVCGGIGNLSCGSCPSGEACALNAFSSECVPSLCP